MENPPKKWFRLSPGRRDPPALRLPHPLHRRGQGRQGRGGRAALHLGSGLARRRRARRPAGEGHLALGLGRARGARPRCASTTGCSPSRTPAGGDADFRATLNPASLETLTEARVEPALAEAAPGARFQFERLGYFCVDTRRLQARRAGLQPHRAAQGRLEQDREEVEGTGRGLGGEGVSEEAGAGQPWCRDTGSARATRSQYRAPEARRRGQRR